MEENLKSMTRDKDLYQKLYNEQGNINTMSLIYIIFSFLIFMIFVIYISIKACEAMRKKPKSEKLTKNLISKA